jgi:toxin ParE1/3/4
VNEVRWTGQAVGDVQAIRRYIARDSPRYGRLVAKRRFEAASRLEAFPHSGRIVPELNRDEIREIIVGEYRIVYRLESEAVTLLTIFRSSRLFPTNLPGLE